VLRANVEVHSPSLGPSAPLWSSPLNRSCRGSCPRGRLGSTRTCQTRHDGTTESHESTRAREDDTQCPSPWRSGLRSPCLPGSPSPSPSPPTEGDVATLIRPVGPWRCTGTRRHGVYETARVPGLGNRTLTIPGRGAGAPWVRMCSAGMVIELVWLWSSSREWRGGQNSWR
jgi:hypothetical protein